MYAAVLMLAMTTSADSMDFGRRGCRGGCAGGYAGCCNGGGAYRSGYYMPGYAWSAPRYVYPYAYGVAQVPATEIRQSFYYSPNDNGAMIRVLVSDPQAQIWFDNEATQQQGIDRLFHSPALTVGTKYQYTIKARWMENGKPIERERQVEVLPGQPVTVDFRANQSEQLPTPNLPAPPPGQKLPKADQ